MMETAIQKESQVGKLVPGSDEWGKKWYAVYTIVRHEKTVNSALTGRSIETFLPLRNVISRWKDRKKEVRLPLFPGYMFINIPLGDRWDVLSVRGVVSILGVNGIPVPISVEQIDAIKKLLENDIKYEPYPYFSQGREVAVTNGPLEGVRGRILDKRCRSRLILSVDIIQRSVAVEVDAGDVELV